MAEALLQWQAPRCEVLSAGSHPKQVHPNAVAVMREYGVDLSGRRAKHLDEFTAQRFDYVISGSGKYARSSRGIPPLCTGPCPGPSGSGGTPADSYPAFQRTASELATRIRYLLQAIARTHQRETPER
jgi:hypothetical protein